MGEKAKYWAGYIGTMAGVACKHMQAAYAGLQKSLKKGCSLVQHSTQGLGEVFWPVEKSLRE